MSMRGLAGRTGLSLILFSAMSLLAACQSGPPQIIVEGAKAGLSAAIRDEAMVTMNIRNNGGPDVLSGVRSDIQGAKVSLHLMEGQRMVEADKVKIPARGSLELKMGGSHVMIEDMPKAMKAGSQFNLTLIFTKSGEMTIPLVLQGPSQMPMNMEHHQM